MRWLTLLLLTSACPERKVPDHGHLLTFSTPDDSAIRLVVERRLARLGVRAKLYDEKKTLTVRLPGTPTPEQVQAVKVAVTTPGLLEFCVEAPEPSPLCQLDAVHVEPEPGLPKNCDLTGDDPAALLALASPGSDAGLADTVLVGQTFASPAWRTWRIERPCLSPRVLSATPNVQGSMPTLSATLDARGAEAFAALTRRIVKRRLLIVYDGQVQSAPLVQEAITGGTLSLSVGARSEGPGLVSLASMLEGGALPAGITLVREGPYGPPSLTPGQ